MVRIEASIKRALWRSLVRKIKAAATSLEDALAAFQDQAVRAVQTGRQVISTGGNGNQTSFVIPQQWLQLTPETVTGLSEEFVCMFEKARDYLTALGLPTDDYSISRWILDNWQEAQVMAANAVGGVTESYNDFTRMRLPATQSDVRTW